MKTGPADTIVAVATPHGSGALAVIRISGPETRRVLEERLDPVPSLKPRRATLAVILDAAGRRLDRALVTLFPKPASYTGEDVVEISCHGGPVVAAEIVASLQKSGARLARPGEFTMRAFLNGKMDLAQAEAVRDLIESRTRYQARVAREQMEGTLSRTLAPIRSEMVAAVCQLETAVEFVEEDVEPESREQVGARLERVSRRLGSLLESFELGRLVHGGATVAIAGRPNAGKSSLFNALLAEERAIVTRFPGTTRDALTEMIELDGIPVRLVDTAGIREPEHPVEEIGIEKSKQYLSGADAVVFMVDRSQSFEGEDRHVFELVQDLPCLLVLNKEDLPARVEVPGDVVEGCCACVAVSALEGTHLEDLRRELHRLLVPAGRIEREGALLTSLRHKECVEAARRHLETGLEAFRQGFSEEFPLYDFRKSLDALAEITGETDVEELLDGIFSTFCIGK